MPTIRFVLLAIGFAVALEAQGADGSMTDVPDEAMRTIAAVSGAAHARNYAALRALMVDEFLWSFGGDGDANQAIDEWRTRPERYLDELVKVLSLGCHVSEDVADGTLISCPGRGNLEYRAGFTHTAQGWKLSYFVAGD